ncbi:UNVERIFIED_CONTAM: hypothetical protein PYX00_000287 [Menopon gallinae]|uniref:Uncharacterized protein n=1 Tax=Menopon gallinae TaxID=328185 RepID=A0AAW2I8E6_9NEOP
MPEKGETMAPQRTGMYPATLMLRPLRFAAFEELRRTLLILIEMPSIPEEELNSAPENTEVRELSQTDHLNKKLLTYYLQRINNGSISFEQESNQGDGDETKDEEWET